MADLHIAEYETIGHGGVQAPKLPAIATQQIAGYTASEKSAAFNAKTRFIRVWNSSGTAFIEGGSEPIATAASTPISADSPEYFTVAQGDKIAVYDGVT